MGVVAVVAIVAGAVVVVVAVVVSAIVAIITNHMSNRYPCPCDCGFGASEGAA